MNNWIANLDLKRVTTWDLIRKDEPSNIKHKGVSFYIGNIEYFVWLSKRQDIWVIKFVQHADTDGSLILGGKKCNHCHELIRSSTLCHAFDEYFPQLLKKIEEYLN